MGQNMQAYGGRIACCIFGPAEPRAKNEEEEEEEECVHCSLAGL